MSPEAADLAQRLRDRWDDLGRLVADAPPPPDAALDLLSRTGFPLAHRKDAA